MKTYLILRKPRKPKIKTETRNYDKQPHNFFEIQIFRSYAMRCRHLTLCPQHLQNYLHFCPSLRIDEFLKVSYTSIKNTFSIFFFLCNI